ncbi:MAG: hypothetical protein JW876_09690 [Candidatus Krumholzibacteriota bacterium]|nr:hypothetical protein [Candidatus Krumholzibacteriota bacterium]
MKRLCTLLLAFAVLASYAGVANATFGWAGSIWPVNDATVTDGGDIGVYFQIWKETVTDQAGQGAGIGATLYYGPNGGPYTPVEMVYNTDVGSNDEYTAVIPQAALVGQTEIWFYCEGYDSTDASVYTGAKDQNDNDPPFKLNITAVLQQDVTVYFRLCFPPEGDPEYIADPGDVCVTGDATALSAWGSGVLMARPCPVHSARYYEAAVVFPAGSNPAIQYKYRANGCADWEWVGNRATTIDDTASSWIVPWVDHWNNYAGDDCPLCGIGTESSTWGEIKQIHR